MNNLQRTPTHAIKGLKSCLSSKKSFTKISNTHIHELVKPIAYLHIEFAATSTFDNRTIPSRSLCANDIILDVPHDF